MLGQFDAPTPYDLNFRLFGFPVRIHPLFWAAMFLFTYHGQKPSAILIAMSAASLSILIHELGHALVMRWYGWDARIVLYAMGGYAARTGNSWDSSRRRLSETATESIAISLAGPVAPFLVTIVALGAVIALNGRVEFERTMSLPFGAVTIVDAGRLAALPAVIAFIDMFALFSVFWGFFNLLPIYPLDGGQIAKALLTSARGREGLMTTHWLSIVTVLVVLVIEAVAARGAMGIASPSTFLLLSLAGTNFLMAQQLRGL